MIILGFAGFTIWIVTIAVVFGALVVSIVASRINEPLIALVAVPPVALALLIIAFQATIPSPAHVLNVLDAIAFAGLAVFAGGPLTSLVLARSARGQKDGEFGGILVKEKGERIPKEVLRGGAAIGYLERIAIVAAVIVGHPEAVALVVAIKGLGRFSELDNAESRERFIIGTLVSFLWAAACAAVIMLPGGALG